MTTLVRTLLMAALLCLAMQARAGIQQVPCDRPFVFSGAAVNVVVLPFALPESDNPVADSLSRLVQREVLLSIAKFGSVGSVQLTQTSRAPCSPDVVREQLLGERPGALARVEPRRALVLVWGRIVEEGRNLYWQTFIDFARSGVRERIELPLGQARLFGQLGAQGFAGPQRSIDRSLIARIDAAAQRTAALYEEPNESSRRIQIPPDVPFYYYVTEIRGEWMRVSTFTADAPPLNQMQLQQGAFSGRHWMKAVASNDDWTLRRVMPEIAFIEGAVGFLAVRHALDQGGTAANLPSAASMASAAHKALGEYDARIAEFGLVSERELLDTRYSEARSAALQLRGLLDLVVRAPSVESVRSARSRLVSASRLQPASAEGRNLTLMCDLWLAEHDPGPQPPLRTLEALRATLSIAPDNTLVQQNLSVAYRWVLGLAGARPGTWSPIDEPTQAGLQRTLALLQTR